MKEIIRLRIKYKEKGAKKREKVIESNLVETCLSAKKEKTSIFYFIVKFRSGNSELRT